MNLSFPAEKITGARIELIAYQLSDAGRIFAAVNQDRARLRGFLPWVDLLRAPADEESYIRSAALQWMERKIFDYGIFARDSGTFLGNIGAHTISWEDERAELGFWLSADAEGKGIVTEALPLLEAELFRLGFHRLEIRCDPSNVRSAAVPLRAGYVHEGSLRQNVIENGVRRDTMIWRKLRA